MILPNAGTYRITKSAASYLTTITGLKYAINQASEEIASIAGSQAYKSASKSTTKTSGKGSSFNPNDVSHAGEAGSNWGKITRKKIGRVEYFRIK